MATSKASTHTRSASLPCASNPLFASAEEHLERLKSSEGASSSSPKQLNGLKDLYEALDDVLQMQLSQHMLSHGKAEQVLDGSLSLLDVCGVIRDCFSQMKGGVKELESSLRRSRNTESGLEDEVSLYMRSKKRLNKVVSKCKRELKKTEKSTAVQNKHSDLDSLYSLISEIQLTSCRVLESTLSFISQPKATSRPSGWSVVSKLFQSNRVSCEGESDLQEVERVESQLLLLVQKNSNTFQMQNVVKQLEALELSIEKMEEALDGIYRLFLKTRVSLLNTFNY